MLPSNLVGRRKKINKEVVKEDKTPIVNDISML